MSITRMTARLVPGRGAPPGGNVTLLFEPVERGVNGAQGRATLGAVFDFALYGYSVSAVSEVKNREEDQLLEFACAGLFGHGLRATNQ
jgi:hypothetical protein